MICRSRTGGQKLAAPRPPFAPVFCGPPDLAGQRAWCGGAIFCVLPGPPGQGWEASALPRVDAFWGGGEPFGAAFLKRRAAAVLRRQSCGGRARETVRGAPAGRGGKRKRRPGGPFERNGAERPCGNGGAMEKAKKERGPGGLLSFWIAYLRLTALVPFSTR